MLGIITALFLVTLFIIITLVIWIFTSKKKTQTKTRGKIFEDTIKEKNDINCILVKIFII